MTKILITRNSALQLTPFFTEKEFFCKCDDFKTNSHLLDHQLIIAAQIIRKFAGSAIYVTSSFRTPFCNSSSGGAKNSWHLRGMALDLHSPSDQAKINNSIKKLGALYASLRKCGINGFGIAASFLHVDTRPYGLISDAVYGSYSLWYY